MTAEPFRPRLLCHLDHHAPSGTISVRLSGSPNVFTAETREEALRIARKIGGDDCRVFRKPRRTKEATMTTFTTPLLIQIAGSEEEFNAKVSGDYEPADGDGWNEPRYPAHFALSSVTIEKSINGVARPFDLTPFLTDAQVKAIEEEGLEHIAAEREEAEYSAAEARAEARQEWADIRESYGEKW